MWRCAPVAAGTDVGALSAAATTVGHEAVVGFGVDHDRVAEARAASVLAATADDPPAVADAAFAMPLAYADDAATYRGLDRVTRPVDPEADLDAVREPLRGVAAREKSRV